MPKRKQPPGGSEGGEISEGIPPPTREKEWKQTAKAVSTLLKTGKLLE